MRILLAVVAATAVLVLTGCAALLTPTKLDPSALRSFGTSQQGSYDAGKSLFGPVNEATDGAIVADLSNGRISVIAYLISMPPSTTTLDQAALADAGWAPTSGARFDLFVTTNDKFCIQATSTSGNVFKVLATGAPLAGACAVGTDY